MKKRVALLILIVLGATAFAADGTLHKKNRAHSADRIVFDLTSNMWLYTPSSIVQKPWMSIGCNIALLKDWPIANSVFSFAAGVGYSFENVQNNGHFLYTTNGTQTFLYPLQSAYKFNRLSTQWFEIPIELRLRAKGNGPLRLYLGAKAGINVVNYYQFIDNDTKLREYNINNINWYRYGVYARLGYAKFNLYASYSLSELFEDQHGPVLSPVSVGLSLLMR